MARGHAQRNRPGTSFHPAATLPLLIFALACRPASEPADDGTGRDDAAGLPTPASGDPPGEARAAASPSGAPVLAVGAYAFTADELQTRAAIVRWRYPEADDPALAAAADLLRTGVYLHALEHLGEPVTGDDLDAEAARVARSTRDPDGLRRLQAICGGPDDPRYRRVGLLPSLANRRYHFEVFPASAQGGAGDGDGRGAEALLWELAREVPVRVADPDLRERLSERIGWTRHLVFEDGLETQRAAGGG